MELDERTRQDLNRWLRKMGIYLGTFVAGGIVTFAYSYHSLHDAKNWEISHLEERMDTKELRLVQIEQEMAALKRSARGQPDAAGFQELQRQLASATTRQAELEKKLDRTDREARDLERSRNSWKAKYAKADQSREQLEAELETANTAASAAESPKSGERNDWRLAEGLDHDQSIASADIGGSMAGKRMSLDHPAAVAEAQDEGASASTSNGPASLAGTP
jgi:DNA repair exonuclease SbcCD ATPase subunit